MPRKSLLRTSAVSVAVAASLATGALALGAVPAGAAPLGSAATAGTTAGANQEYGSPGQGPVTPAGGAHTMAPMTAAGTAPSISRSEVLHRAQTWVGIGLDYNQSGSYAGYRTDCSGYVSMAWHLSQSLTTNTFASAGVTTSIGKSDLEPGDALLNDSAGNSGHVVLFDKWSDTAHDSYMGYEFTGSGVHYREIPYPYFSGYGTFLPVRNTSVTDDDPGMTDLTAGHADGSIDGGSTRVEIGPGGWNGMSNLTVGDFNGDGKQDVVGVESSTGKLWLYRGHGDGTIDGGSTRTELGTGWNSMTNLFAGDFNGDGKDDLGGVETSTGKLFLYRGHGDGTIDGGSTRTQLGTGWNSVDKLVGPGDMNGDGKDDLVATETSTGKLFLYRGHGDGTIDGGSTRVEIGSGGWNGISDYAGGDFDGDGTGDLAAVESQPTDTGALYLYKGTGSGGLAARVEIGSSGW
jgi:hypothetical protein